MRRMWKGPACLPWALALLVAIPLQALAADPLPSWNDGPVKQSILAFVTRATTEGGPGYIPPEERIATFDNDGTLWQEKPVVQGAFLLEQVKAAVKEDASLAKRQPFKAVLEGDVALLSSMEEPQLMELFAATYGGKTPDELAREARAFFQTARHPKLGVPYTQLAYAPMLELLQYLRANGFQTWISSGGGTDFMRVVSEGTYGIPPQQVIGSSLKEKFDEGNGHPVLRREARLDHLNDKAGKPVGIEQHIGRRPVFAAGNVRSGGDIQMLQYTKEQPRPGFSLLINHDDAEREFAYQEKNGASLKAAREDGWTVVSMRQDWKRIFPEEGR
ncbi:haloacid dehalogenase-like hydrolase [Corallococcus exiguus]|uniref:HAD family hydrolase n=1 Tax=Corallococcus TaxID=83461 RepID=UPI000EA0EF6B|nr:MULTISPECIES: HAD family hydrolase [Corallococcus]NNC18706.1 haloacid dehalogenase-like hydrolase [Corallococcus exiguus]RKH21485.1 haloacid dehalogenase-like hydrolase [Corallococcus sp. CA041A]RKI16689.1 haloacid dehalogenase-like hydrolase [Corallococcus sp. AB030]RUO93483.1 haloacid dehalogenase-like hydrolase [Corallococcus sp. AB018]